MPRPLRSVPPCSPARRAALLVVACVALAVVALAAPPLPAAAHAELERADPPPDGLLAAPPARLELWLTEAADQGAGSPSVRLFDASGREISIGAATVDPTDPRHVVAEVGDLNAGAFTVGWSVRSAADGHVLSGTYGFRVGAVRAPGAATVQGEAPEPWAVATRWLTFLGTALTAAGFAFARLIASPAGAPGEAVPGSRRRRVAIVAGTGVALLATLAEPALQTIASPAGAPEPTLLEAVRGLPDGWWLRLVALLLLGAVALLPVAGRGRGASWIAIADWAGLGFGLAALIGLSLTSHAAAREAWRPLALASNVLHQWAVALWVGGLAHLALAWPMRRAAGDAPGSAPDPVRRFSRLALGLVVVGVGTGLLNTGLILPSVRALWESPYGRVLLLKLLMLVPVLALATFHRAALRRAATRLGVVLVALRTVRLEAALALLVVLGGSVLTLMAPPGTRAGSGDMALVDLAAGAPLGPNEAGVVHLQVQPAEPGENAVVVRLTGADGEPMAPDRTPAVEVAFTPLDHGAQRTTVAPRPDASGGYAVGGVSLPGEGWWRADVTLTSPVGPAARVPFYLALPDPNASGEGPTPNGSDGARAVFERGLAGMTSLHRVRFGQRLTDGKGGLYTQDTAVSDGSDGRPPSWADTSSSVERIIVGDREWIRRAGQPWTERPASPLLLPADWGETYERATGFRLGTVEEIDGEACQIVTFVVPATTEPRRMEAAWFAWWVGTESGRVRQEAMVSRLHYMIYRFRDFDAPFTIEPPADVATAVAHAP